MSRPFAANDYAAIRARCAELAAERQAAVAGEAGPIPVTADPGASDMKRLAEAVRAILATHHCALSPRPRA